MPSTIASVSRLWISSGSCFGAAHHVGEDAERGADQPEQCRLGQQQPLDLGARQPDHAQERELGAARTVLLLYLAPLYGALLAWLILGEPPHLYHAVGAALILPSIALASRR